MSLHLEEAGFNLGGDIGVTAPRHVGIGCGDGQFVVDNAHIVDTPGKVFCLLAQRFRRRLADQQDHSVDTDNAEMTLAAQGFVLAKCGADFPFDPFIIHHCAD